MSLFKEVLVFEIFLLTFPLFCGWRYYLEIGPPGLLLFPFFFQYYCSFLGLLTSILKRFSETKILYTLKKFYILLIWRVLFLFLDYYFKTFIYSVLLLFQRWNTGLFKMFIQVFMLSDENLNELFGQLNTYVWGILGFCPGCKLQWNCSAFASVLKPHGKWSRKGNSKKT